LLNKKYAIVTGASKGIGRAIALDFAKNGANVGVNFHSDEDGAQKTVDGIKKFGVQGVALKADVSNSQEVSKMFDIVREKFGKLNIVVNNAGIYMDKSLKKMEEDVWDKVMDTNLKGVFNVTKNAIPLLEERSRIINISSIVANYGNFGQVNYCASKAGVIGFSKALAKELGKYGTTVNVIAPGFIETDMTERMPALRKKIVQWMTTLKKLGSPDDIAHAATFLASDNAGFITGEVLNVNGGLAF
jgi:3-oxoacyl-[acyl-carrier protein] reductase